MITNYQPGPTTAVIHQGSVVLVGGSDRAGATLRVWDVLSRDQWDPMDVIEVLSSDGLAKTPDFAVAAVRGDRVVLVARGGCVAQVTTGGETHDVNGRHAVTWVEQTFAWSEDSHLVLRADDTDVPWWPIASGVVFVSAVRLGTPGESVTPEQPEAEVVPEPESVPEVVEAPVELEVDEPQTPEPEPEPETEPGPEPEPDDSLPADPNATLADVDQSRFDAMFGATIAGRRLEDAAVREEEPMPPVPPPPASIPAPIPQPPADEPALGDHAGDTVSAAELARLRAAKQEDQAVSTPPPSPAAAPMPSVKAALHLSTGRTVELDRPCVIGRAPRSHGATSAQLPQTVVIDNPYISGTHVVVAVEDGVVTATDLSTNGTLLTRPGQDPVRLDKGRETIVTDGCVLSLSDDITVKVAVTRSGDAA